MVVNTTKNKSICLPYRSNRWFYSGGALGSEKPVEVFFYNPRMLLILGITIFVVVPLCYYAAKWMFNYAYGKHLKKLKILIEELSQ